MPPVEVCFSVGSQATNPNVEKDRCGLMKSHPSGPLARPQSSGPTAPLFAATFAHMPLQTLRA